MRQGARALGRLRKSLKALLDAPCFAPVLAPPPPRAPGASLMATAPGPADCRICGRRPATDLERYRCGSCDAVARLQGMVHGSELQPWMLEKVSSMLHGAADGLHALLYGPPLRCSPSRARSRAGAAVPSLRTSAAKWAKAKASARTRARARARARARVGERQNGCAASKQPRLLIRRLQECASWAREKTAAHGCVPACTARGREHIPSETARVSQHKRGSQNPASRTSPSTREHTAAPQSWAVPDDQQAPGFHRRADPHAAQSGRPPRWVDASARPPTQALPDTRTTR